MQGALSALARRLPELGSKYATAQAAPTKHSLLLDGTAQLTRAVKSATISTKPARLSDRCTRFGYLILYVCCQRDLIQCRNTKDRVSKAIRSGHPDPNTALSVGL